MRVGGGQAGGPRGRTGQRTEGYRGQRRVPAHDRIGVEPGRRQDRVGQGGRAQGRVGRDRSVDGVERGVTHRRRRVLPG